VVVDFGVGVVVGVGVGVGVVAAFKMVGVIVGLTLDETAGVDEGGSTEDFCLQRLEFWRFPTGTRGTSRGAGAGAGTRGTMALW